MDAFTTHPDLNAVYETDGGGGEAIAGLRAGGRLYPVGDPDHIVFMNNDCDTGSVEAVKAGHVDATSTHGWRDLTDMTAKLILTHLYMGTPVPHDLPVPIVIFTPENIHTVKQYGITPIWPWLPEEQYDLWPVMDTTEIIGLPTPTKVMRMEYMDY